MKIELTDTSGLPDALKELVSTEDDKNYLDLGQLAPASELDRFKSKAVKAEQEAIDRRKALDAWKGLGDSPDDVRAKLDAKPKGGKDDEEHERIVAQLKEQYEGKLGELNEKLTGTYKRTTQSELKAELSKAGFTPGAVDMIANHAMERIQFNDDGTPKVLAQDKSGPMIGSGSNGGATLADLAKQMASDEAYSFAVQDGGKGGGGKPPGSNGGTPNGAKRSEMSHSQKAAFIREKGREAYNQLPE